MQLFLSWALGLAAGVSVMTQQVLNANLRGALNSAVWAGFASYFVGLASMGLLVAALREPVPALAVAARAPWVGWSGGLFGAIFIALSIFLVPRIGAAAFIALLVAGQMLGSLAFDHFGVLGLVKRELDLPRMVGAALLVAGVVLIRR